MNLGSVSTRIKNLIVNPRSEWQIIATESISKRKVIRQFVWPLILLVGLCSVLGDVMAASRVYFSFAFVTTKALGVIGIGYAGMYLSGIIVNELNTSFNTKKNIDATFTIMAYSLSVYYVVEAFVMLLPFLRPIIVFQAFSVYLFWQGVTVVSETPEDNKAGFVVVSSLITLGVFIILNKILEQILLGVFGVSMALSHAVS
jgi:hypothetical protein